MTNNEILREIIQVNVEDQRCSLLDPKNHKRSMSLEASFWNRRYFKDTVPNSFGARRIVQVSQDFPSSERALQSLLWEAMFGRKFRVIHWYILFDVFLRQIKTPRALGLRVVLEITLRSKDPKNLYTNLDSVKTVLGRSNDVENTRKYVQEITKLLHVQLPKKRDKEGHFTFVEKNYDPRKPKIPQRKRGYDDKGHLADPTNPFVPGIPDEFFEEAGDTVETLLNKCNRLLKKYKV